MNGCGLCSRSFDVQNRRGVWLAMQIRHDSPSFGIVTGQTDDECQFKAGPSSSLNPALLWVVRESGTHAVHDCSSTTASETPRVFLAVGQVMRCAGARNLSTERSNPHFLPPQERFRLKKYILT